MSITYNLRLEDRMAFVRAAMSRSPFLKEAMRRQRRVSATYIATIGAIVSIPVSSFAPFITSLGLAGMSWLSYPRSFAKAYLASAQRQQEMASSQCIGTPHRFAVTDRGLESVCQASETLYPWSSIAQLSDTADHLLIFFRNETGVAIPRAGLTEGDFGSFRAALAARVGSAVAGVVPTIPGDV